MSKAAVNEENVIRHALDVAGGDAYCHALNKGVAVTVLQGNKIQRVYPNGEKVLVRTMEKSTKKVIPKSIRLK